MYITQRKKVKIWKIIHITSYVFNFLFLLLLLIGLCGCSSSNNNDDLHKQRTTNTIQRKLDLKEDTEEWNGIDNYITRNSEHSSFTLYASCLINTDFNNFLIENFFNNATSNVELSLTNCGSIYGYTSSNVAVSINYIMYRYNPTYGRYMLYQEGPTAYSGNRYVVTFAYQLGKPYKGEFNYGTSSVAQMFYYITLYNLPTQYKTYLNTYIDSLQPPTSSGESSNDSTQTNIINLGVDYNPLNLLNKQLYQNGYLAQGTTMVGDNALVLTGLTFQSNNMTFDTIRVQYYALTSVNFSFDNGSTILNVADFPNYSGYIFPLLMQYQNSVDNTSVNVLTTPLNVSNTGDNYYSISTRIWTNNEYQTLNIISDDETIMRDNMTTKQLLSIQGSVDSSIIGGYSPFTLFSSAFTSIASILNIAILPGITIGLLLFMPLLVLIITLIFKMVKK